MDYVVITLIGLAGGGIIVFVALQQKVKALQDQRRQHNLDVQAFEQSLLSFETQRHDFEQSARTFLEENEARGKEFNERVNKLAAEEASFKAQVISYKEALQKEFHERVDKLAVEEANFKSQVISYKELRDENTILKDDLLNLGVHLRKSELDHKLQSRKQEELDQRAKELATRYLKDNVKWIGSSLNQNNYVNCKQRLQSVIERCRDIGFMISNDEEAAMLGDLKSEYEKVVRAAFEREEQARIRAQIREEQLREREIQRELQQLEREREAIKVALEKALADARGQHSEEVQRLQERLAEAEAKSQRAISQAQLTKTGHVYVISNIGSFGEQVFKVGMTRRLEPHVRVVELGDASVPFPFDVHMMIASDDAPTLENALHRKLHKSRINKINPRREFFRTDIETIYQIVKEHQGEVEYIADPEALQYRQSLTISDDDQEFIERMYDDLDDEAAPEDTGANEQDGVSANQTFETPK